jgi:Chaperone for flagella basal body P-ring formation
MRHSFCSRVARSVCWISALSLSGIIACGFAEPPCYNSPNAAIDAVRAGSVLSPLLQVGGYRVTGFQSDPILGRRWAIVASCDHAEWPVVAVQTSESDPVASSETNRMLVTSVYSITVVHAGDVVRLWKQEDLLRIEVVGVAEENGGLGKIVRVRLLRRNADDQATQERFLGVVRGPSDVEMQR